MSLFLEHEQAIIRRAAELLRLISGRAPGKLKETRWALINIALENNDGHKSRAAQSLGVHRNTLSRDLAEMREAGREIFKRKPAGTGNFSRPRAFAKRESA